MVGLETSLASSQRLEIETAAFSNVTSYDYDYFKLELEKAARMTFNDV